ncbi:C1-like protein [Corchorus olitorius]|uniref:C1-like protein n=1 Tax=Corchorus olitorius TaxID=93759 RepID=A0A1R3HIV5_9ROSI|nr:C1-like protein [Corchorus olitorius]
MDLKHFNHEHPLVFIQDQAPPNEEEEEAVRCYGCKELAEGPIYCCGSCEFYLHKKCAELALEIDHSVTAVISERSMGEGKIATEIKHADHDLCINMPNSQFW